MSSDTSDRDRAETPGDDVLTGAIRRWVVLAAIASGLQNPWRRYGVALAVFGICAVVRLLLHPVLGTVGPFGFFLLGSTVASLLGGFGPGLLVTVLGGLAGALVFSGSPVA